MPLSPGARLGPYEVLGPLGSGGMGDVYRAHDTKLGRDVALKVLPDDVAGDPERLKRFEREARTLAALNHPHIAQVYGFEDSGTVRALVMELVPGESLAERLSRGAPGLPVRDALEFARQIADGLEAAHDKGIVHRDLKPANVQVTPDGQVKILDFGLAKALSPGSKDPGLHDQRRGPGLQQDSDEGLQPDIENSPTLTAGTRHGIILGTAAYMSPEQARGLPVDARTDIWAFGGVLYEMLTGTRAFPGPTVTDLIAQILERDPDWTKLPAATPAPVRRALERCLRKDPKQRLHHIADARFIFEDALASLSGGAPGPVVDGSGAGATATTPPARAVWRHPLPIGLAAVAALALGAVGLLMSGVWMPPGSARQVSRLGPVRFTIEVPAGRELGSFAMAPDGSLLAYIGTESGQSRIYARSFNRATEIPLPGTEGAVSLFFSADSRWIGFFARGRLLKIPAGGGEPVSIADAPFLAVDSSTTPSGAWAEDGTIVVSLPGRGLSTVAPAGGSLTGITTPTMAGGDQFHLWPEVLPASRSVLYTVSTAGDFDAVRIEASPTGGGDRKLVFTGGGHARYVPTGHLLFAERGRLAAVEFDSRRLSTRGEPISLVEGLGYWEKKPLFEVSAAGDLAYAEQAEPMTPSFVRFDRHGRSVRLDTVVPGMQGSLSFAMDGNRVAGWMVHRDRRMSIVLIDLQRGVLTHVPAEGSAHVPIWLPDGESLVYSSDSSGPFNLFVRRADGSGSPERLTSSPAHEDPGSLSGDGRWLAYAVADPKTRADIWSFDLETRNAAAVRQTPADERNPALSADGRWVAYASNESGRFEVYVEAFPRGGNRMQLSVSGGSDPVWCAASGEIFYLDGRALMAVKVDVSPGLRAGPPSRVLELPSGWRMDVTFGLPAFAVSSDGQYFYVVRNVGPPPALRRIHVVLNWLDEFKQRVAK